MSRLEGIALGGYYPTPTHVIPRIASYLQAMAESHVAYLDPCAGKGEAVIDLIEHIHPVQKNVTLYTIELETTRHKSLKEEIGSRIRDWRGREQALQGDAFNASWDMNDGVSVLWLNPPYDFDPVHGRLEHKFLQRFAPTLMGGGVLIYLVPFYALAPSVEYLAKEFSALHCYRFPEADFTPYKQVVLFGIKRETPLLEPDADLVKDIQAWSNDAESIPVLATRDASIHILPHKDYLRSFNNWTMKTVDFTALLSSVSPWSMTDRRGVKTPIPGILPEGTLEDLLTRKYPLAMPPRAAHIAAGIAAGIFNGSKISPDDATSTLPSLLVKGVFDKEFKTVEEKTDKDGNVKGLVQVQQPKLVTTVLDLSTNKYTTIKASTELTSSSNVEEMTMADLLHHYGRGLMNVMLKQCPVLHDPKDPSHAIELPSLQRPLYAAQKEAVTAAIKLLGGLKAKERDRKHKAVFVLGEIGSGKTQTSLAVAEALKRKRVLVMCPPHLLASWEEQIKAVVPWFRTIVLSDVTDVQKLMSWKDDVPTIAIMSREAAKLGHSYASVLVCGACGTKAPEDVDHAKKRSRCEHRGLVPKGTFGRKIWNFAFDLLQVYPTSIELYQAFPSELITKARATWAQKKSEDKGYEARAWAHLTERGTFDAVVRHLAKWGASDGLKLLEAFFAGNPREDLICEVAELLYARGATREQNYYSSPEEYCCAQRLMLMVPPSAAIRELAVKFREVDAVRLKDAPSYQQKNPWDTWEQYQAEMWGEGSQQVWPPYEYSTIRRDRDNRSIRYVDKLTLGKRESLLVTTLAAIQASFVRTEPCGEPLYQAVPEPCRYPLATYIARRAASLFDLFIADEAHELSSDSSAQGVSASRIVGLGIPTLLMTGSVMNGYADSLFTNMWNASADFRQEYTRDERSRFIDRFGYRKRLVEDRDKETKKIVEYGSMSDRVQRSERMIGEAPGVLPLFLLRYLLPLSVTLHKSDLSVDIPPCTEITQKVATNDKILNYYKDLQESLIRQIKRDRFEPELAGKLWGAMAELPSYLDLATEDVGNNDTGRYEIRYPDSVGGGLVASAPLLPAATLLPKEEWLIEHVKTAFAEGRNVLVLAWHTRLLERLSRILEKATGEKCPVLNPAKVPTHKRQDWIDREIIKKKRRVLIANPVTVSTGLNNLVYFADEVWHENPGCNSTIYRQTVGRVDRIGQKTATRIMFPLYKDTAQEELHSLLLHKVAVSMSVDGLDGEAAMNAAGIGAVDGFSSFSVGKQLYELLLRDHIEAA